MLVLSSWFGFDYYNFGHLSDDAVFECCGVCFDAEDVEEAKEAPGSQSGRFPTR